jgi:UDP-2-acetamido-2,6-beta-L-arabino-hexul-4-ose reductase
MIIGDGDIASILKGKWFESNDLVIVFASGVSNSKCVDVEEFEREKKLLLDQNKNLHLVYFSTLSIYYKGDLNPYTLHKLSMEEIVKGNFENFTIVRIGNITWGKNPNTLLNFFRQKIQNNEPFEVRNEYRYLVNEKEFLHWLNNIRLFKKDIITITGNLITVPEIVNKIRGNEEF